MKLSFALRAASISLLLCSVSSSEICYEHKIQIETKKNEEHVISSRNAALQDTVKSTDRASHKRFKGRRIREIHASLPFVFVLCCAFGPPAPLENLAGQQQQHSATSTFICNWCLASYSHSLCSHESYHFSLPLHDLSLSATTLTSHYDKQSFLPCATLAASSQHQSRIGESGSTSTSVVERQHLPACLATQLPSLDSCQQARACEAALDSAAQKHISSACGTSRTNKERF